MSRKIQRYKSEALVVSFEPGRCIHAARCVHGLPDVFDPQKRPWIELANADAEKVAEIVRRCPTGALKYTVAGEPDEPPAERNTVQVRPRGPLYVRGRVELRTGDGEARRDTRLALCRCGASKNKPHCDNSHRDAGFTDGGTLSESRLTTDSQGSGKVTLTVVPNGPVLIAGPVEIEGTASEGQRGDKGALCRCGASKSKPYCDGSHKAIGFQAE